MEGFDGSVHAPAILYNAGVKMALKSGLKRTPRDLLDHPVLYARYLIVEAAIAHYFGLPEQPAIQSVTAVPARGKFCHDSSHEMQPLDLATVLAQLKCICHFLLTLNLTQRKRSRCCSLGSLSFRFGS